MAKMKIKLDMSAIKQFLFEKGERVGLIACTAIMVLVVGYALYSGMSSRGADTGEPWDKAISTAANRVRQQIQTVTLPDEVAKAAVPDVEKFKWVFVPYTGQFLPLFPLPDRVSTKKLNPYVLPLVTGDEDKLWQLLYYQGGVEAYEIDVASRRATAIHGAGAGGGGKVGMPIKGGQAQGNFSVAKTVRPTKMVVVSAIFPMRDQLEEFRKALRYATVEELLAHRTELPKPVGIEVLRYEILPGNKATDPTYLFKFEKGKWIVLPELKDMLRRMLVDDVDPQLAAQYVFPGLVTPLPKLANAEYAKLELKGFDVKARLAAADGDDPMMGVGRNPRDQFAMKPNMPGKKAGAADQPGAAPAGAEVLLKEEPWTKLSPDLQAKFNERFELFDPLAQPTAAPAKKGSLPAANRIGVGIGQEQGAAQGFFGWDFILGGQGGQGGLGAGAVGLNPMRGDPMEDGGNAAAPNLAVNLGDALVRFFDPTVESGKTYCYLIRVRMANPNLGKLSEVAFQALAQQKELEWMPVPNPQGWVVSPAITIPGDYYWYATDQAPETKIKGGADYGPPPFSVETTPIQVQRWLGKVPDPRGGAEWLTADWAIAERLHTRRGEPIGRREVMIEMARWNRPQQMFEITPVRSKPKAAGQPKNEPAAAGIPVDLMTNPPVIVVDFEGGKKLFFFRRDGNREYVSGGDESAFEVLALMPDGRLVVRNSRIDSDNETFAGAQRQQRFDFWNNRISSLRQLANPLGGGGEDGPMMPNVPQR